MASPTAIQQHDMLDIIFYARNKAYGAYRLRRDYPKYLSKALGLGLLFIFALFGLPRLSKALAGLNAEAPSEPTCVMTLPNLAEEVPPPPPPPPVTPPPPVRSTVAFLPPVILEDDQVDEQEPPKDIEQILDADADIGTTDFKSDNDAPPTDIIDTMFVEPVVRKEKEDDEPVEGYDVQKMPSFPGGPNDLQLFLSKNIEYPAPARENGIQGTVALSFVVDKEGRINDIKILKDPGGGCGTEAIRVVKMMPKWVPGEANGHPVKVRFTLPVRFRLE